MSIPNSGNSDAGRKIKSDQGGSTGKPRADTTVGQSTTPNRPPPPKPEYNPNK